MNSLTLPYDDGRTPLRRPARPDPDSIVAGLGRRGFNVGSEVLVGRLAGVIVGYNVGVLSRFVGAAQPLLVRTARGIARCRIEDVKLV